MLLPPGMPPPPGTLGMLGAVGMFPPLGMLGIWAAAANAIMISGQAINIDLIVLSNISVRNPKITRHQT